MSERKIIICGYSGHGLTVVEAALDAGLKIGFYADKSESLNNPFGLSYLGTEDAMDFAGWQPGFSFVLGIGNNLVRAEIAKKILANNREIVSVIANTATVVGSARVGSGAFISRHAVINTGAVIGDGAIINTGAIVEHECVIGNYVHIAPGAVIAGNVKIGHNTFVGANAVIKQGVVIGDDVTIGAGTVVLENIATGKKVVGNPGRLL